MTTLETACAEGQQTCQEAQHNLQTFVTHSPVAIVILDIETGQFIEANPAAEQLFGFPRATLLEMCPFELSPPYQPDGSSSTRANEMMALAVGCGDHVFEWWYRNARGERIACEVGLARVRWCGRDVIRGAIVDLSTRKKLELFERGRRRLLESIACGASLQETLGDLVARDRRSLTGDAVLDTAARPRNELPPSRCRSQPAGLLQESRSRVSALFHLPVFTLFHERSARAHTHSRTPRE